jgi:hypothetical protein
MAMKSKKKSVTKRVHSREVGSPKGQESRQKDDAKEKSQKGEEEALTFPHLSNALT